MGLGTHVYNLAEPPPRVTGCLDPGGHSRAVWTYVIDPFVLGHKISVGLGGAGERRIDYELFETLSQAGFVRA